ncbi:MAG: hypothetical protein K2X35_08170 [Bryobacteraceae bacterium]|nr:hypothetical protein [Bryobacteraceae bacterium]
MTRTTALLLLMPWAAAADPVLLDRIAISIENFVITEGQLLDDIRINAFLAGVSPDLTPPGKKAAADRLVNQALVLREMQLSRFPMPETTEAAALVEYELRKRGGREKFDRDLSRYELTEKKLLTRLEWQTAFLRFVEYRFRPGVRFTNAEVEERYQALAREAARQGRAAGTLEQVRGEIEELLAGERVNQALDRWLGQVRTQVQIHYRKQVFE